MVGIYQKNKKGTDKMCKEKGYDLYPKVILSDCTISEIQIKDNKLILIFSSYGFAKKEEDGNYYRTEGAEIIVEDYDRDEILIKEKRLHQLSEELYFESMFDIAFETLLKNVNSGKWKLEIVEEFYATGEGIYICHVREGKGTFWIFIKMRYRNIVYLWNNVRYDWIVN